MGDVFLGGDILFQIVPIFIGLVFVIVIGIILVSIFSGIRTWHKNEKSPRLTVPAKVVAKRTHIHHNGNQTRSRTTYYVTFQFESSDRSELSVSGQEYGLLVEDDNGSLTFQGTRFIGFVRI